MKNFIYQSRKMGQSYTVSLEKGGLSYTWQRWKRGLFGPHIRTKSYIGSYPTPELLFYCARKASNKTIKVTGNDGHKLVWKAVASYLWMNVQPYLVDFYSDWPGNSVAMITDAFLIYSLWIMTIIIFIGYDRKRKAERRRLPDDMFCNTCKSTLLTHF